MGDDNVQHLLYLDSDTLVLRQIDRLLKIDLGGKKLA